MARDQMDWDVITNGLRAIYTVARAVPVEDVEAYLAEIDRTDTLMPFLDPSAYLRIVSNIPAHRDLARAFLTFRRELAKHEPAAARES